MNPHAFIVGGEQRFGAGEPFAVRNPFDGGTVALVGRPRPEDIEAALAAAVRGVAALRGMPAWKRGAALAAVSARVAAERERCARMLALEAGKPIRLARAEVDRAVETLRITAEEARRIGGELLPLDAAPGGEGRIGLTRRFPVGPVACITPFNFPLNLVVHKVAPALAAGCAFVLKPASRTPLSALYLAELLLEAGFPPEAVSVLPLAGAAAEPLVEDPRIRALSFTGSAEVGWALRRRAFRKKVVLELGGNAGLIVDRSADLELAATRSAAGGFGYAGQSCIAVQRIFVHEDVAAEFTARLVTAAEKLIVGDPLDEATTVGPMIAEADAARAAGWIDEALRGGAKLLTGGTRRGSLLAPTVLTGTSPGMRVCAEELFAPVVVVESVARIEDAIAQVNRSEFGLQAGIFTRDLAAAFAAWERIEAGAVVVNDVPTYRADAAPYGGVKSSGLGREGPRYAIEDFTELRLLVLAPGASD